MHKRRTVALISLAALACAAVGLALFVGRSRPGPDDRSDLEGRLGQLRSVPYTNLTPGPAVPETSGVLTHLADEAYPGYNLYCSRVSPEVFLIDMAGEVVHTWSRPGEMVFVWDHAVMLPDGDVLVVDQYTALLRLDWESNLLWKRQMEIHHEVAPLADGTMYAVVREVRLHRGLIVRFPAIVHLDRDGQEIDRWSSYDHLDELKQTFDRRSFLDTILDSMLAENGVAGFSETIPGFVEANQLKSGRISYDYFHLNTISVIPDTPLGRRDTRFREGNLLVCFRNVNQVAVLDKDTKQVLWTWGEGVLEWPHHPTMLESGRILVFDNGVKRKYSRVLEVDPSSLRLEWQYVADRPETFYTYEKGSAQRLPNGNTLVCEGDRGRAFEVARGGKIVWDWFNPMVRRGHRVQLYRITRVPASTVEPLLKPGA